MKITRFVSVLVPLAFALGSTCLHADEGCPCNTAPSGSGACSPAPACDLGCDCCDPGTNKWDGTLKVGAGLRTSMNSILAHDGGQANTYNYFNPDDMRIYMNGTAFGGTVKGTLNTEIAGGGTFVAPNNVTTVELLDGIAQLEVNDYFNVWTGRFLPMTDRANLDGPFYQTPYDYPFVSNYPSLLAGRDDGAAYWGQAGGGKLKWQVGIFNGIGRNYDASGNAENPNGTGNYMYMGRITINLLDPEPGYYTQSCYFGEKEILAIGLTAAYQHDGGGSLANASDFSAFNADILWEHKLSNCGVIDVEAAFYRYQYGLTLATAGTAGADVGTANQGNSEYCQVSYLLPNNICLFGLPGKLQPFARYQYYDHEFPIQSEAAGLTSVSGPILTEGVDLGVNYVVSGYNCRYTLAWGQREGEGVNYSLMRVGVQLQF